MYKIKKQKRPKSKRKARHSKKRMTRSILKKAKNPKIIPESENDPDFLSIIKEPSGLRSYLPETLKFNGVEPEFYTLQNFQWMGLITLKFYSESLSKSDSKGMGSKNRFDFLAKFMDNLTSKLRIKDGEFNWCACEEFGFSGMGHLHVIFSFDYLKAKGRENKIPNIDFSENCQFYRECLESVEFVSQKLGINPKTIDFNWRPKWENSGLIAYFCKKEWGIEQKRFKFSKYWTIHRNLLAA